MNVQSEKNVDIKDDLVSLKKQLKKSQKDLGMLELIYNGTNDFIGLLTVDDDDDYTFVSGNKSTYESNRRNNVTDDQFLGVKLTQFLTETLHVPDDEKNKLLSLYRKVRDELTVQESENVVELPNKVQLVVVTKLYPITDDDNQCTHILYVTSDITERRKTELALIDSEKKYRDIFESFQDIFFRYSENKILIINPSVKDYTGYPYEYYVSKGLDSLIEVKADLNKIEKIISKQQKTRHFETLIKTNNNETKVVSINFWTRLNPKTNQLETEFMVRDVSELKELQAESIESKEQLLQANKMSTLGTLVSSFAHEINNPNNNIMMNSALLKKWCQDISIALDEYYEMHPDFTVGQLEYEEYKSSSNMVLDAIQNGSHRIKSIVSQLKSFSKKQNSGEREDVKINEVIETAIELIKSNIDKSTNNFSFRSDPKIPILRGNFIALEQVIINLIENSCHALPDTDHYITVESHYNSSKKIIEIKIIDNGLGISSEIIDKIKEPFFTTKREKGGLGLGLSITSRIIKEHGGKLEFSSLPGSVTMAVISIPII